MHMPDFFNIFYFETLKRKGSHFCGQLIVAAVVPSFCCCYCIVPVNAFTDAGEVLLLFPLLFPLLHAVAAADASAVSAVVDAGLSAAIAVVDADTVLPLLLLLQLSCCCSCCCCYRFFPLALLSL